MNWIYIAIVTVVGILLRLGFVLTVPNRPIYDFQTYQDIAVNIFYHRGHTYLGEPIAFQGMGYPTVLGYFYRLMGNHDVLTGKMFNVICSSLTLILFLLILRRLTDRKSIIYPAYTVLAFLPNYIAYNNVIGTEVFVTFLFCAIIWLQVSVLPTYLKYPLLGIFIAGAALTKPFFMAYPVLIALVVWMRTKGVKDALVCLTVTGLVMAAVMAPWTYRNYEKFGRFIPVSYNSGYVLAVNNNDNNTKGGWMPLDKIAVSQETRNQMNKILQNGQRSEKLAHELDPLLKEEGKKWILSHPGKFLELGFLRLNGMFFDGAWDIRAWAMNDFQGKNQPWSPQVYERNMNVFIFFSGIVITILSTLGLSYVLLNLKPLVQSMFRRSYAASELVLIPTLNLSFFLAVHFVFEGQARYNFPLLFLLVIGTVVCVEWLRCGNRREITLSA